MARPKKDLYQGRSLFDFIEQDIKHNFKTLEQGEANEQGNNTRGNEATGNTAEHIHTSSRILGKDKMANKQGKSVVYDGNDGRMRVKNTRTNRHADVYGGPSLFSYEQGGMGREGEHDKTEIVGREEKGRGLSDTSTRELFLSRRQGHGEIRETITTTRLQNTTHNEVREHLERGSLRQLRNENTRSVDVLLGGNDGRFRDSQSRNTQSPMRTKKLRTRNTREQRSTEVETRGLFGLGYSTDERNGLLQVYPTDHTEIRQELSKRVEQESLRIDFRANGDPHIGSPKSRFNKNIEAITLLKQLEQEERYATLEEQKVLNLFSSWGGIPQAFDINNKDWQQEYELLQSILSKEEYERARNATQDAFYTPEIIIDVIYKGLEQLGLNNTPHTKEIFEPSIGIGSFLSYAHKYGNNYAFSGIELDDITYRIAKKLYPNQEIFLGGFQNHGFNRDYDAFISNPPYGEKKIADELNVDLSGLLVCDYFVARSIQNTKQDGIIAFVVSDRFLDKPQNHVRELIAKEASFLGAIRLPNNTFKGRANTGVTTDIVFFKKGFDATINKDWIESKSYIQREGKEYSINEYFLNNPQHIAGDLELVTNEHKDYKIVCIPNKDKVLTLQLDAFIKSLPKNVYQYRETTYKQDMKIIPKDSLQYQRIKDYFETIESGNYFVLENEIYQKTKLETQDNIQVAIPLIPNQKDKTRIIKMIAIRDTLNSLITLEKNSQDDHVLDPLRQKLNRLYDDFVKTEGYLNRDVNKKAFKHDRHSNKILALEKNYNKGISKSVAIKHGVAPMNPSAEKSDIFYKRTIAPSTNIIVNTPKEALIASLNKFGGIDLDYMQELLQKSVNDRNNSSNETTQYSKDSIKNSLLHEKLVFINHNNPSEYILANHYLSGNVKKKYKEVKAILEDMQSPISNDLRMHLESNLESLEQILPKDLKATQINAEFGAAWILCPTIMIFLHRF